MAQKAVEKLLSGEQINTQEGGRERVVGVTSPSNGSVILTTDRRHNIEYRVGTLITFT